MYFRVYRATDLPKLDYQLIGEGTIDAYLKIIYRGQKLKTKVIKQQQNKVDWMTEFLIPVPVPSSHNKLELQIWDKDVTFDEKAASVDMNIKEILKHDKSRPSNAGSRWEWINLYGAPVGYSGSSCTKMNDNPEVASTWKGRVLVEYWVEDCKFPEFKIRNIDVKDNFDRAKFAEMTNKASEYTVAIELGSGFVLPSEQKYKLKLAIGDEEWQTGDPKTQKGDHCRWNERFVKTVNSVYQTVHTMPTFYVYLVDDDGRPVCYYRGNLSSFSVRDGMTE